MKLLVNIDVDDLAKAARFYGDALGLTVSRRLGAEMVELSGAAAPIYLLAKAPGSPAALSVTQSRDYLRHWTPVHLDFAVDDIAAATKRAVDAAPRRKAASSGTRGATSPTWPTRSATGSA